MKRNSGALAMRIIGFTGGVGSGKTEALAYIREKYHCRVILADEVAHRVKEPGQECYGPLVELLGTGILAPDGRIDRAAMAEKIFAGDGMLGKVNALIHPAVKRYVLSAIGQARKEGTLDFLFVEAALLIEDGYGDILDELWYIHAPESVRRARLKESRSYSEEKITGILASQLPEEEYRKHCRVVIDNGGSLADTCRQIDGKLEEYL